MPQTYKALTVTEEDGQFIRAVQERRLDDLPEGDLLIKVKYSSLNYKDALSAVGNRGVTKNYPHTPGIDAAGVVEKCESGKFEAGDEVVVTGYDLGMNTPGGFGQYIRVPSQWALAKPEKLLLKETMIIGTAGLTAAGMIDKMGHNGLDPEDGPVLVTGASGGVGSIAVAILGKLGYEVCAATGKQDQHYYLRELGASEVLSREDVDIKEEKPLLSEKWAGVVDTVGGNILSAAIRRTRYGGSVSSCGVAQSPELDITVFPFILRGINLLGVASAETPLEIKKMLWDKLSDEWKPDMLEKIGHECGLDDLNEKIDLILQGKISGRTVVNLHG